VKRFALVLLFLVACTHATQPTWIAGTTVLRGIVVFKDGSPLPGVTVSLDQHLYAVTGPKGQFVFNGVAAGKHTVVAQMAGFGSSSRVVTLPASGVVKTALTLSASVSESITVTAEAPLINSSSTSSTYTYAVSGLTTTARSPSRLDVIQTASYAPIVENDFVDAAKQPVTTFSIDVDGASYANVRRFLTANERPPANAVRIEEMVNYFTYRYPEPADGRPVAVSTEVAGCPWAPEHRLLRIGIRGKSVDQWRLAPNNLVFLIDVSGSMSPNDRLPLIKDALRLLVGQLRGDDSVSIVVYAGAAGLVLPKTSGANKDVILAALDKLEAGGSTAGAEGIELAYKIAQQNFQANGNNRVILATDGDFNVGMSSVKDLTKLIESKRKRGIYLTCIGVGNDNYKDDAMEMLAGKGNGNYYYLDSFGEAKKVFGRELTSTLVAVADDVKVQLQFDPAAVASYRQIGYEDRAMANEDFANDAKDAGEIGAAQSVTALYELVPATASRGRIGALRLRYKEPGAPSSS
jgi:Ca-activated chloride channel family protein